MKTRVYMVQRTAIQRDTLTSDGGGGYTQAWNIIATVPCRAYQLRVRVQGTTGAVGGAEEVTQTRVEVKEITAVVVPPATDVVEGDRLVSITDRLSNQYIAGPMMVDSVGQYPDHKRLTVRRVA